MFFHLLIYLDNLFNLFDNYINENIPDLTQLIRYSFSTHAKRLALECQFGRSNFIDLPHLRPFTL